MKIFRIAFLCCFIHFYSFAQVGVNTSTPDASAASDVYATNKGMTFPNVKIDNVKSTTAPVSTPVDGLVVYNDGSGAVNTKGYYYNQDSEWNPVLEFQKTPKEIFVQFTGSNIAVLDNQDAGGTSYYATSPSIFNLDSGYIQNVSIANSPYLYGIKVPAGVYDYEISYLLTAPAPDAGRGSVFDTNTGFYFMGYLNDLFIMKGDGTYLDWKRTEEGVVSKLNEEHRVTFKSSLNLSSSVSNSFILANLIGRMSGSSFTDLAYIIPSGTYIRLIKIQ